MKQTLGRFVINVTSMPHPDGVCSVALEVRRIDSGELVHQRYEHVAVPSAGCASLQQEWMTIAVEMVTSWGNQVPRHQPQ